MMSVAVKPRVIRAAGVQVESRHGQVDANHAHAMPFVEQAAREGAELVVLPELFASGYFINRHLWDFAEPAEGPTVRWLRATARKLGIHLGAGFVERDGEDFFNCWALATPDGEVAGRVRKTCTEYSLFKPGALDSHVIHTVLGTIGVGICADNHSSFLPRLMQQARVDLILMPHAWPLPFRTSTLASEKDLAHSIDEATRWAPLYARLLGVPAVFVNQVGPFGSERWDGLTGKLFTPDLFRFGGISTIADSDGTVKGRMGQVEEGVIAADVTLDPSRKVATPPPDYGGYVTPASAGASIFRHIIVPIDVWSGRLRYRLSAERRRRLATAAFVAR
jgi:N-carbamoylputrescine amidase